MKKLILSISLVILAITTALATPAGEKKVYNGQVDAATSYKSQTLTGLVYYLYFEGNTVHFPNPFGVTYKCDTVIDATISNNKFSIATGTTYDVLTYSEEPLTLRRYFLNSKTIDTSNTPFEFSIVNDTIVMAVDSIGLCLTYPDTTLYTSIGHMKLVPYDNKANACPESATIKPYHCNIYYMFDEYESNSVVRVGRDGNDIYINGMVCTNGHGYYSGGYNPSCWLKGTMQGSEAHFAPGQYLGPDQQGYHLYFSKCHLDWDTYNFVVDDEDYVMTYNEQNDEYTCADWGMVSQGDHMTYYYPEAKLTPFEYKPAKPATPVFKNYSDYLEDWGEVSLNFNIPMVDVDSNFIDPDSMTYCLYVNDEVFTFTPEKYYVENPTTELDYFMMNGSSIINSSSDNDTHHHITLYFNDYDKLGVQSFYNVKGVKTASDIMWYVLRTGVEEVNTSKQVVAEEDYDLSGRRVMNPSQGIYIHRVIYSDGTTQSFKRLNK